MKTDHRSLARWSGPYTLDNGLVNDCSKPENCDGKPAIPGLWELPMYASFDSAGAIHLMDPWLDDTNTGKVLASLKDTFNSHYLGKRQPFGLFTHPIHLATGYPGLDDPYVHPRRFSPLSGLI
jgi:hypothetical protein